MTEVHGAWKRYGERLVYDNRWVRLGLVDVEAPNGERWEYHVVHLDRIAVGLIIDERDRVLMLWRYRFPTDQWGYELLGGLVEEGEEPAATARREIVEETGWRPVGEPDHLISFEPLPGQVTAPVDVYLWREAEQVGEPTDTEEVGRVEWVYPGRALTAAIVRGALRVFEDFHYVREIAGADGGDHALVFRAKVNGLEVHGCDFLHLDENGLIDDLTVMVRPLSAANALAEAMGAQFERIRQEAVGA